MIACQVAYAEQKPQAVKGRTTHVLGVLGSMSCSRDVVIISVSTVVSCSEISGDDSSDKIGESRGAKKPRLVWTSELHARFMNAVNHLVTISPLCNGHHCLRFAVKPFTSCPYNAMLCAVVAKRGFFLLATNWTRLQAYLNLPPPVPRGTKCAIIPK